MAVSRSSRSVALVSALVAAALLAGCPLPFEYNGKGSSSASSDPSSPNMTAPVTVSYAVQGGATGAIADGLSLCGPDNHGDPVHDKPERGHLLYHRRRDTDKPSIGPEDQRFQRHLHCHTHAQLPRPLTCMRWPWVRTCCPARRCMSRWPSALTPSSR